jgi:hypothetical protein
VDNPSALKNIRIPVNRPELWSAEIPNLYTVLISLQDASGKVLEAIPQKTGFQSRNHKRSFTYQWKSTFNKRSKPT